MTEGIPREEDLTFNIIFIPGAFSTLGFLTLGLLNRLNCSFRLVSNGCGPEETRRLESFCRDNERLDFLALPFTRMVDHGSALNYLQKIETSGYFCFMDADIVAGGNFLTELLPVLAGRAAVFSGRPVWQAREEDILPAGQNRLMGRYCRTGAGFLLGCSYFAIYRNLELNRFIETFGFCFDRFSWPDLPPRARLLLVKMGLPANYYDTGKVLNILLQERGLKQAYHEAEGLYHIGGLSCGVIAAANPPGPGAGLPEATRFKRELSAHLLDWFRALFSGGALPPTPAADDAGVFEKVERLKTQIRLDYHEFKDRF
jgi:hypothetical protein